MSRTPRSKSRYDRQRDIELLASRMIDLFEQLRESSISADRIGDRYYTDAKRKLKNAIVDLLRATAEAAVAVMQRRQ